MAYLLIACAIIFVLIGLAGCFDDLGWPDD